MKTDEDITVYPETSYLNEERFYDDVPILTEDDKKQFIELEDENYFWFYHSEQGFINSGTSQQEPT